MAKPPFLEKSSLSCQEFKQCTGVLFHYSSKTKLVTLQEKHQFSFLLPIYIFMKNQLREGLQTNFWLIPCLISKFSSPISVRTQTASTVSSIICQKELGALPQYLSMYDPQQLSNTRNSFHQASNVYSQSLATPWVHSPRARFLFRVMWKSTKTKVAASFFLRGV